MRLGLRALLSAMAVFVAPLAPSMAEVLVYQWNMDGTYCVSNDSGSTFTKQWLRQQGYLVFEYIPDLSEYNNATLVKYWKQGSAKYSAAAPFFNGEAEFKTIVYNAKGSAYLTISDFDGLNNGNFYSGPIKTVRAARIGADQDMRLMALGSGQSAYQTSYVGGRQTMGGGQVWLRLDQTRTRNANISGQTVAEVVADLVNEVEAKGYQNVSPVAVDDTAETEVNKAVTIDVLANDYDPTGEDLSVSQILTIPSNGTAVVNADYTITYTPKTGWFGSDTFIYQVVDASGGSDQAMVTVTVTYNRVMTRISQLEVAGVITQSNGNSTTCSNLSYNGRYVAFVTSADNLAGGSSALVKNILVYDRSLMTFSLCNNINGIAQGEQEITGQRRVMSSDTSARYLVIASETLAFPNAPYKNIYVMNRGSDVTLPFRIVSCNANVESNGPSGGGCMDSSGKQIAFHSDANNLIEDDTNGATDVFVVTLPTSWTADSQEITRVSVSTSGQQANADSRCPAISQSGRYVAFQSLATNLVTGDTNDKWDVYFHDRDADGDGVFDEVGNIRTTLISAPNAGGVANGDSYVTSVSSDGRYIVFYSSATNLVVGDTNNVPDVFIYDRQAEDGAKITRISVNSSGTQGNSASQNGMITGDGRYAVFESEATNLVGNDNNGVSDVFIRDRVLGLTSCCSVNSDGIIGDGASHCPSIAGDGHYNFVLFYSYARNFVDDSNGFADIFMQKQ